MNQFATLDDFLSQDSGLLASGPIALIFVEDMAEVTSALRHHCGIGFRRTLALVPQHLADHVSIPADHAGAVRGLVIDVHAPGAVPRTINRLIAAAPPTTWFYYGYNAEYLLYPFHETRNVSEMLAFHGEERRDAMIGTVIDLYAPDLSRFPDGVSVEEAMFDRRGYYALTRHTEDGQPLERQYDIFGGLRWRQEEHIPWTRRHIDRVALFRAQKGLTMRADHSFSIEEYNTLSCPWHHNMTAAVASFRTAKALRGNPSSKWAIDTFAWEGSARFEWSSRQLMDLGFMEPGQWF